MKQNCKLRKIATERGFSMLEYAAGAAVIAGVVYVAFNIFGQTLDGFFTRLTQWVTDRTNMLS